MCREEGFDLSTMKNEGRLADAAVIGIVKEVSKTEKDEIGIAEFNSKYFPYPLYFDEEKAMYKYLGNRKITSMLTLNPFSIWRAFSSINTRMTEKGISGNLSGDGATLGGIIVYSKSKGVVYQYKEQTGSEIPKAEIENAVKSC